jgi:hypothetical protein
MGSSTLVGWRGAHAETRYGAAPVVAQAFLLAGSRDFPVPCSRARFTETWNWRLESRLYPPTGMSALRECQDSNPRRDALRVGACRSASIPACGFTGLSGPVFQGTLHRNLELATGKSPLPADKNVDATGTLRIPDSVGSLGAPSIAWRVGI